MVSAALDVVGPMLLKAGVDNLRNINSSVGFLYIFSGLIVLASGIGGFFRFLMRDKVIGMSRFVEADIRYGFFRHLSNLAPRFFDRSHTGDLMTRTTEDVERTRMVLGPALLYSVNTVLIIGFSAIMMFALDTVLATWVLLLAPLVGGAVFAVARKLHKANLRQQETYGHLTSYVQENLTGIRVIKAFVRENHESRCFADVCRQYLDRSLVLARTQAVFMPLLTFLIGIGTAGILWVGGHRIATGELTLGEFIAFMSYLSLISWPMIALGWITHLYQRGSASYRRLQEILTVKPQFDEKTTGESDFIITGAPEISFKQICFGYNENGSNVLNNINLKIPAGSTTAIVGQVGSGKSTLVRLLARLYEPKSGEILINDHRWDELSVSSLRRSIGYVDQTPFLFSATIKDNISLSMPDTSMDNIEAAAHCACFDNEIEEFPDGYETLIGERGVTLSGGQQQRLTLARALLIDPPILVLDDSLSSVDADTEAEILGRLSERREGRTTLFVTHRLSAAENADLIAVLENGSIVEFGTHTDLMTANGLYTSMYNRQRLADELGAMA